MNEELKQRVFSIIKGKASISLSHIDPDKNINEQITFDSIHLVGIITEIEKVLEIQFPISVMEVTTVNEFLAIIEIELNK